jgi:hypothetical protein
MKRNQLLILIPILLLIVLAGWILYDLIVRKEATEGNPYDYGMGTLRKADTVPSYTEILPVRLTLEDIRGIASDRKGKIYVAGKDSIAFFSPSGKKTGTIPISGFASCITVLPEGNLAIGMEDHVEIREPSGKLISKWPPASAESMITSIAADQQNIYVADAGKKVVWRYDHSGKLSGRIGEKDPQHGIPGFVIPSPYFDLGISPEGALWVVNPGRHSFEHYSPDGILLGSWGEASLTLEGFTGCCNPSHFAFLPDGSFVTSEKGLERIKVYSPEGVFQRLVASPESFDEGTRGLDLAAGMEGRILVLDPARRQIRTFLPNDTP